MVLLSDLAATKGRALLAEAVAATEPSNRAFLAKLGEGKSVSRTRPSLFVMQGEKAIGACSLFDYVGSEDATTCVVIIIEGSGMFYVSHVDSGSCELSGEDGIAACTNQGASSARVYLAGAYTGDDIIHVLQHFRAHPLASKLELQLCCCGSVNLAPNGFPLTRSLILDLKTMTPLPYTFEYRGPEIARRHAARSSNLEEEDGLHAVLDPSSGRLVLQEQTIDLDPTQVKFYSFYLALAQNEPSRFLQSYSTSPLHESDLFIPDMVAKMRFLLGNNHRTLATQYYTIKDCVWTLIQ